MTSAKPGIVLHVGGDGELAAGLDALDQDRLKHRAGGIDRGGVTGRAGPDNDDFGMGRVRHVCIPLNLRRRLGVLKMPERRWCVREQFMDVSSYASTRNAYSHRL